MALDTITIEKPAKVGLTVMWPDAHASLSAAPLYISKVAAGMPSPADDYVEKTLDLNTYCLPNSGAFFFLRVSGNSMTGAAIHNGDILVVDRSIKHQSGQVVIAIKVRARVEHIFAAIEQMGGKRIRTIGQVRANFAMTMMVVTSNIKRLTFLEKGPIRAEVCP